MTATRCKNCSSVYDISATSATIPVTSKAIKPKVARKTPFHPTYSAMIRNSVSELKGKSGSSKSAILKYMMAHYKLGDNATKINNQLRMALKRAVTKGELKQVNGSGASGSFRLDENKASAHRTTGAKRSASSGRSKSLKKTLTKKPKAEKKTKSPRKAKAPKAKSGTKKLKTKTTKPKVTKSRASKTKAMKKVKA